MSLEKVDCFHNQYYNFLRRLLVLAGLWPYLKRSRRLPSVIFITIVMLVGINGQMYIVTISILDDRPELIIDVMQTLLPTILFSTAYWCLLYSSVLTKEILELLRNDWKKLTNEDEMNIMVKYAAQSKVASQLVAWSVFLYIPLLISPSALHLAQYISGIIDETRVTVPIHHEIFVTSKHVYYFWFLMQTVIIFATCVVGITHYILFITLLQHACALFIIVTTEIEKPFKGNEYKFDSTHVTKNEAEFVWITIVAKNYNYAIKFVELIRSLYGKMYLIEVFTVNGFVIMNFIYFFQLLNFMVSLMKALKICVYINGSMLIIYAYCFLGERLIDHSSSVYAKCRLLSFHALSHQTNKLLLLLIMRSTKPCKLSLSGTVVASHELFAKIMKTSFSFATVFFNSH